MADGTGTVESKSEGGRDASRLDRGLVPASVWHQRGASLYHIGRCHDRRPPFPMVMQARHARATGRGAM